MADLTKEELLKIRKDYWEDYLRECKWNKREAASLRKSIELEHYLQYLEEALINLNESDSINEELALLYEELVCGAEFKDLLITIGSSKRISNERAMLLVITLYVSLLNEEVAIEMYGSFGEADG